VYKKFLYDTLFSEISPVASIVTVLLVLLKVRAVTPFIWLESLNWIAVLLPEAVAEPANDPNGFVNPI
jgi:hypothetical protein